MMGFTESPGLRLGMFAVGDYVAGGAVGAGVAAAVSAGVGPGTHMAIAMPAGMLIGMVVSLAIGLALSSLLGFFYVMMPGSLIGMYGGMLFAMWASFQVVPLPPSTAVTLGLALGLVVSGAMRLADRVLRGPASRPAGTAAFAGERE